MWQVDQEKLEVMEITKDVNWDIEGDMKMKMSKICIIEKLGENRKGVRNFWRGTNLRIDQNWWKTKYAWHI